MNGRVVIAALVIGVALVAVVGLWVRLVGREWTRQAEQRRKSQR